MVMEYLDHTCRRPAENLALDEALLDACESGQGGEVLRFWAPREPFVVVGYGNAAAREVDRSACRSLGIPILRRCSGGGSRRARGSPSPSPRSDWPPSACAARRWGTGNS